jgi:hypothetical protein
MRHDPERLAARFLDGQMRRHERWRYERHLVECAECWTHVQSARAGRSAAESLREVAPARVRERVRAVPGLDGPAPPERRRRRPMPLLVAAAVLAALFVGVVTYGDRSRDEVAAEAIAQVAAAYHDGSTWAASATAPPVKRLTGLRWDETRITTIDDDRVIGFRYTDGAGKTVLVVQRDGTFAAPPDAHSVRGGEWATAVDGVTVFCTHPPESVLVVGAEPDLVASAARALAAGGA